MAKSALIIGGTGQIGRATTLALLEAGWDVSATHRGGTPPADVPAVTLQLDRADTDALSRAASGRDLVVDTVAFSPADARQLVRLDVGALAVISSAAVYVGSNGTYLEVATDEESFPEYPVPITEDWPTIDNAEQTYSPLKAAMERVLLAGELPVSILRAGAIHGPHSRGLREWYFIKRVLDGRGRAVLAGNGGGRFHPASTVNIAALIAACAEHPGRRALNAVDDECPSEAEIGRTIFEAMGHPADIVTFAGPPRGDLGGTPWGVAKPFVLSMERARHEVGYVAKLSYAEAVRLDIEWVLRTIEESGLPLDAWREIFPGFLRAGADDWFDYDAEDEFAG